MKREVFDALQTARAAKRPAALVTELDSGRQAVVDRGAVGAGALQPGPEVLSAVAAAIRHDRSGRLPEPLEGHFVAVFNPPLRLAIVGAVHTAQLLAPMAELAGYEVTLIDPRRAWASPDRFPGLTLVDDWPDEALAKLAPDSRTAVVTLTHDPKLDDPALIAALNSEAFYLGALGSRRTHATRLERLRDQGCEEAALARIHGPIGLPLGGRSPAEIAIAVLAQMTQVLHGAGPLRAQREAAA
ncbi:MAG: XdhC family protein [Kiloniellales bacterium]|nr:XdhC family protein [Kiloniellales bacterium]